MPEDVSAPLRSAVNAFNEDGVEAALEYFDPEIEWWAPPDWLEDRLYKGYDGLRRLAAYWNQLFDDYRVEPDEFTELGDGPVVALLRERAGIRDSGDPVEQEIGYIAEMRDGRIVVVHVFFTWDETREAAGLPA